MYQRLVICALPLFTIVACASIEPAQTAEEREINRIVSKNPDLTAEEANTNAKEFVVGEADGSRVICKRQYVTGSRFKKKICMTWAEWRMMQDRSGDALESLQRNSIQADVRRGEGG